MAASTLYHHSQALHISANMTATQALQAIAAWARGLSMDELTTGVPAADRRADRKTCASVVADLRAKMRRDLFVKDVNALNPRVLLLTGLAVVVEARSLDYTPDNRIMIELLVETAPDCELHLFHQLAGGTLATQGAVDVMYVLAPSLATLFHTNNIGPEWFGADKLGKIGGCDNRRRPVLPACIMQPAKGVPCMGENTDGHVGECIVYAQQGLQQCGYHLPDLRDVALVDMPLSTWVQQRVASVRAMAEVQEVLARELRAMTCELTSLQKRMAAVGERQSQLRRMHMMLMPLP